MTVYISFRIPIELSIYRFRGSIVVSISACHAEDPGSIPGRGVLQFLAGFFGRM